MPRKIKSHKPTWTTAAVSADRAKLKKFYGSAAWQRTRTVKRFVNPTCERCGEWTKDIHHKIDLSTPEGWERRLDPSNLESCCKSCHSKITNSRVAL
jgi:5-methylcytosine-specific restriction endonuclease McrA